MDGVLLLIHDSALSHAGLLPIVVADVTIVTGVLLGITQ